MLSRYGSCAESWTPSDSKRLACIASFDKYLPVSKATRHVQGYRFSSDCVLTFEDKAGDWVGYLWNGTKCMLEMGLLSVKIRSNLQLLEVTFLF
jgi:hypothetical protein